jgi:hypothetical protein
MTRARRAPWSGEVTPVVLLSLFFSGRATAIGPKLLLLSLLGVLIVLVVVATLRIERSMWITRMINRLADTSAQIRIRLSILLVVGLGALATHLGFEAILGAFIAGAILRLVDADAEHKHPLFHPKLDAIGYGFLIPVQRGRSRRRRAFQRHPFPHHLAAAAAIIGSRPEHGPGAGARSLAA